MLLQHTTSAHSDEVATASTRLGQTLTSEELDVAMADMDKDNDGTVDFEEFLTSAQNDTHLFS
jgi:Ca2+-binding EF-hand superfamily protein